MTKGVWDEVCDTAVTPSKAASRLLSAMETRIESHPQDIKTFIELLGSFAPWKDAADDMRRKIAEMESQVILAKPVSESSSYHSQAHQQPFNIRVFISPGSTGVVATESQTELHQERTTFQLRSAPVHRKHPESNQSVATTPASKHFTQVSSPLSSSSHDLSDRQSSSSSLAVIPEEEAKQISPKGSLHSPPISLSSQSSTSSAIEEEVLSVRGTLDVILQKCRRLEHKLCRKDRKVKALEEELATKQKTYDSGMATANQANIELQDQMMSLQLENKQVKEEVDIARRSVVTSNQQKQQLLDQLQDYYTEVKKYQDLCAKLEVQVKEANQGINFYAEYQKAEATMKEQEQTIESYKRTIKEHEEKITLLETEIDILVSVDSSITTTTAGLTSDSDQEDSNSTCT